MRGLLLGLCTALLVTACGSNDPGGSMSDLDLEALQARPRTEAVLADYAQVQTAVKASLDRVAGTSGWSTDSDRSDSGCPGGADSRGQVVTMDSEVSRTAIPDEKWPAVVQALTGLLAENGFGAPRTVVDVPGNHQLEAGDELGGRMRLITQELTLLSFTTGCLLPQADGS